jgi:hypothetical protein
LNDRPFQRLPGSRRSVFEALDRPARDCQKFCVSSRLIND